MDAATKFKAALNLHQQGQLVEAEAAYTEIVRANPDHFDARHCLSVVFYQRALHGKALRQSDAALALRPKNAAAHAMRALILMASREHEKARIAFEKSIALDPNVAEVHNNLGLLLRDMGRKDDAIAAFDRAIALDRSFPDSYSNRGLVKAALGHYEAAIADFDAALLCDPNAAEALSNRGGALYSLKRYDEAIADLQHAIALAPAYAPAHNNLASALNGLGRHIEALAAVDCAIAANPKYAEAHSNRGAILLSLGRYNDAIASAGRAVALDPNCVGAHYCQAAAFESAERYEDAAASYGKALALDPALPFVPGARLYAQMHSCTWDHFAKNVQSLLQRVSAGENVSGPYPLLAMSARPAQQLAAATAYCRARLPVIAPRAWTLKKREGRKLRIGYFSADYRKHATAYLVAGMLECHDRSRFELVGFSFVHVPTDAMRRRLESAFDRLIDVSDISDPAVAQMARDLEVDIAVDLMGHNGQNRMGIFANRAAPLQVNYLGYPGTTGAAFMDYIVADGIVIPEGARDHYAEKVVHLPHSYQANDSKRTISDRVFTREELGLPAKGFVFCCFNNNHKITPDVFDMWMRLLRKVDGSVLWLLEGNSAAVENLHRAAQARGIAPERLVFARRMDLPDHLARHRMADLFLDTLYYGAHTTASDALWTGLPVVTTPGETFASRVCASLLTAVGLPELVADNLEGYERLALDLAANPEKLAASRRVLEGGRLTFPLFDTRRFTRNMEAAYERMWERREGGLPPDHITVVEPQP